MAKITEHATVIAMAARKGILPSQLGLAWLLAHSSNTLLIPGTSNPQHLEENVAAGSISLDETDMRTLDALVQL